MRDRPSQRVSNGNAGIIETESHAVIKKLGSVPRSMPAPAMPKNECCGPLTWDEPITCPELFMPRPVLG